MPSFDRKRVRRLANSLIKHGDLEQFLEEEKMTPFRAHKILNGKRARGILKSMRGLAAMQRFLRSEVAELGAEGEGVGQIGKVVTVPPSPEDSIPTYTTAAAAPKGIDISDEELADIMAEVAKRRAAKRRKELES